MDYSAGKNAYSRWASEEEIKSSSYKVNLKEENTEYGGMPLYYDSDNVYLENMDYHSLILGPTGSKKTRLIVMPSICLYARAGESFIATDPKAELYERAMPILKKNGYHIFVLNFRDPLQSNCWNPLIIPYLQYHNGSQDKAIEFINDLANNIVKDDYSKDPYWQNSAADLLTGLILILCECTEKDKIHFKSLRALRTQAFKNMIDDNPFIRKNFLQYLNSASFVFSILSGTVEVCDTTRGCIVSVFDQAIRPFFSQENLINMLSVNDLDMSKIGNEKTAVFLIIPDENTLYHKLISVFVKQCYTELISEAMRHPLKRLPRRVNFLLDEFSSLPQISDFPAMITASRSRNIRFNLVVQSIDQLRQRYGSQVEIIRGNCENWVFLHSRELSILDELSNLSGKRNCEDPLVSVSMLQTLDKDKGEAFILHRRKYPFITRLLDIDNYPEIISTPEQIRYPRNFRKTNSVFDFEEFCESKSANFLSQLFTGKTRKNIAKDSRR